MPDTHAHLLINTGSRQSQDMVGVVRNSLQAHGIHIDHEYQIRHKQPLDKVLQQIIKDKPRLLIVGGGDGTISSVMGRLAGSSITLGVIPLGTTNNSARSLGLPLTVDEAVAKISSSQPRPVDLGLIGKDHFTNVAGIGLSAQIAKSVTPTTKRWLGRFAYGLVGAWRLATHKPFHVTLHDQKSALTVHLETHQLIIANGSHHAGRKIAADAKLNNHELIIFALGGRSKFSLLWHTFDFYTGRRKKIAHAYYMRGTDVSVHTSTRQPVELDGEPKQTTPLRVQVDTKAIEVRF